MRLSTLSRLAMPALLAALLYAGAGCADPAGPSTTEGVTPTPTQSTTTLPSPDVTLTTERPATSSTTDAPPTTLEETQSIPLGPLLRYEDADLGFSFVYPQGWTLAEEMQIGNRVGGSPLKSVGAFDPTGNRDGGKLLEGVSVSVFELGVGVNADLFPTFREEVERNLSLLQAALSRVEVLEGLRGTRVGDISGLETTFTFDEKGRRLRTRLVFLVVGTTEYQIVAQASDDSYDVSRPRLDLVVDSFRIIDR